MELTRAETELIERLRGQTGKNFAIMVATFAGQWHIDRYHLDSTGQRDVDETGYESGRGSSFDLAWNDLSYPRPPDDKPPPLTVV